MTTPPSPDRRRTHPLVSCLPVFLAQVAGSYGWSAWVEDPKNPPYARMVTLHHDGGEKVVFSLREDGQLEHWQRGDPVKVTIDEALVCIASPVAKKRGAARKSDDGR